MDKLRKALAVCMALTMMSVCAFSCGNDDDDTSSEKTASASQSDDEEHEEEDSEEDTEEETTKKSRRNKKDDEEETTEEETSEDTTEETTAPKGPNGAPDDDPTALLPTGYWWAVSETGEVCYFFSEDSSTGSCIDAETGAATPFTYTYNGTEAEFFPMDQTTSSICTVEIVDDKTIYFNWTDGTAEVLTLSDTIGNGGFFSNDELCRFALDYYEMKTGYRPGCAAAASQPTGEVVIQLYDNMGDHNSTCDWYTVDRVTGKGTNLMGEEIDLISSMAQ
jgi:hypothetical protein